MNTLHRIAVIATTTICIGASLLYAPPAEAAQHQNGNVHQTWVLAEPAWNLDT